MKGWKVIHKIKAMYDGGLGSSMRQIAEELGISRKTVRKYLRMDEDQINDYLNKRQRKKALDDYREYVVHLLQKHPKLSSVKIERKLRAKGLEIPVSARSLRRYVSELRKEIAVKQERYYEPVIDMLAGVQCQVDPGELRAVEVGGKETTIYFCVFVLSFSRLMYVSVSDRPINTEIFLRMHNEAFSYFDGLPEECVYDQTKLVVIREEFMEGVFNERFYHYATAAGFEIRLCHGYDPESKGKVEAGVKYVKNDFFYGERFASMSSMGEALRDWLDAVANVRTHGTTGKIPRIEYDCAEYSKMKAFRAPAIAGGENLGQSRKVDKTSLISYKSNKYSVPMQYQSGVVRVHEREGRLFIYECNSSLEIAVHDLSPGKSRTIKNTNHYRDQQELTKDLEDNVIAFTGEEVGRELFKVLRATSPKIYKDQLRGLLRVLKPYKDKPELADCLAKLAGRPRLAVSFVRDYLEAFYSERGRIEKLADGAATSQTGSLSAYEGLQSLDAILQEEAGPHEQL